MEDSGLGRADEVEWGMREAERSRREELEASEER